VIFIVYLTRLRQLKLCSVECSGNQSIGQIIEERCRTLTEDTIWKYVPVFFPGDKAAEAWR
jgi:hypothetical protein